MLRILLSGASGRMGRQMAACLDGTAQIVAGVDVRSGEGDGFVIYLPARTALVLRRVEAKQEAAEEPKTEA